MPRAVCSGNPICPPPSLPGKRTGLASYTSCASPPCDRYTTQRQESRPAPSLPPSLPALLLVPPVLQNLCPAGVFLYYFLGLAKRKGWCQFHDNPPLGDAAAYANITRFSEIDMHVMNTTSSANDLTSASSSNFSSSTTRDLQGNLLS